VASNAQRKALASNGRADRLTPVTCHVACAAAERRPLCAWAGASHAVGEWEEHPTASGTLTERRTTEQLSIL